MAITTSKRQTRVMLTDQLARLEADNRSLGVLLERAEQDRDRALQLLSTCAGAKAVALQECTRLRAELETARSLLRADLERTGRVLDDALSEGITP